MNFLQGIQMLFEAITPGYCEVVSVRLWGTNFMKHLQQCPNSVSQS